MKKIFFAILCSTAVISCAKDVVITADQEAITFENAFVDNATKAAYDGSYNNSNLSEFQVYATITGTGSNEGTANIFEGERVVKGNSLGQGVNWSYATANTQYWIPGNDYQFRAIAEGNVAGVTEVAANAYGMATAINLLDASAQKDILVAEHSVTNYTKPQSGSPAPVAFTFDHILAKAKFTVKNTITTDNGYSYKVYNLSVNGIAKNGVYTFGAGWAEAATRQNYDLAFGHAVATGTEAGVAEPANIAYNGSMESNYDRLLVPTVAEELNVTFTYELLKGDVVIDTQDKSLNTGALTLVSGSSYNFVISLGNPGDPIQFDVEKVNDWDQTVDISTDPIEVATAMELIAAIENGNDVVLTQDINLDVTRAPSPLVISKNVVLDGNGYTLTSTASRAINVSGADNVVIKNATIVATGERAINVIQNTKNVYIENVTATAANYTVNVAGSASGAKVTIKDSDLTGLNVVNVGGSDVVVEVHNTKILCNDQTDIEPYSALALNKDAVNSSIKATNCELVVLGDSFGGSNTAAGSTIEFVNCTGTTTVRDAKFAIVYGNYHYSFSTFENALSKALAGETILVTKDLELSGSEMHVPADKNIVVDLNGKTVTVKSLDPIKNRGTMTLKNGRVVADNSENTRRCVYNYGTMIIEDVEFVQTYNKKGAAINNEGKMTLNDVTVDAVYYSVWAKGANVETVINGGSFTTTNVIGLEGGHAYAILTSGGAKLTVNNAEVTGNHGVVCAYDEGSVATINSGKFTLASPSFTEGGNSSWVFYAALKGEVKYNEAACELVVPASKTNGVNTTEEEGKITKF